MDPLQHHDDLQTETVFNTTSQHLFYQWFCYYYEHEVKQRHLKDAQLPSLMFNGMRLTPVMTPSEQTHGTENRS